MPRSVATTATGGTAATTLNGPVSPSDGTSAPAPAGGPTAPESAPVAVAPLAPDRIRNVLVAAPAGPGQRMNLPPVGATNGAVRFAGTTTDAARAPHTLLARTHTTGTQKTTERLAREHRAPLPRPSVPQPAEAGFGGGDAAGGGLGFSAFGAAALVALFVVVTPGMAWALVARARPAAAPPFLSLLERPG
jgi:hypothetical protein